MTWKRGCCAAASLELRADPKPSRPFLERCTRLRKAGVARVRCEFRWKSKIDIYPLNELSLDELWRLHEAIVAELSRKITAEKAKLEERED